MSGTKQTFFQHLRLSLDNFLPTAPILFVTIIFRTLLALMSSATLELDGLTSFSSHPGTSFRFTLTMNADKVKVWLEDRKSKKQWQSEFLATSDFITAKNAIPGATLTDYAQCFKKALEESDDAEDVPVERQLRDISDDGVKLEFVVHLKVFTSMWSPSYSLALSSVAVEKVDMLESRVFDVEQAIERVEQAGKNTVLTELSVENNSTSNNAVVWSKADSKFFEVVDQTSVQTLVDGIYMVNLSISTTPSHYNHYLGINKNGQEVLRSSVMYNQGHASITTTSWIFELKKGEKLSVIGYGFSIQVGSKMVLTKIGG